MPNTNKYIKSFILFESDNINSDEIPWEVFWEFIQDSQDVFMEIMDDDLLLSDYGKYSFDYQDDFIFLKFKKPTDLETISFLWEDIKIAINRLSDKYNITHKVSDLPGIIKLVVTLENQSIKP
jgi:hypothetical protein